MGFLVVKTGDSTCRPRDSKEGYLYRTGLGFTKLFSGISKRLETCFVKTIGRASKQDSLVHNPLCKTLLMLFVIA